MLDAPIRLYTGEYALSQAPGVLALQGVWTAVLLAAGLALWHSHQRRLIIQGG